MADQFIWMPLGADVLESDSYRLMTDMAKVVFIDMLWRSWNREGLPDDPHQVARLIGRERAELDECWPMVRSEFFELKIGLIAHRSTLEKREQAEAVRVRKVAAALQARNAKDRRKTDPSLFETAPVSEPESSPDTDNISKPIVNAVGNFVPSIQNSPVHNNGKKPVSKADNNSDNKAVSNPLDKPNIYNKQLLEPSGSKTRDSEPSGSGGDAPNAKPNHEWDPVERVMDQVHLALGWERVARGDVTPQIRAGSPVQELIDQLGEDKAVSLFVYAYRHWLNPSSVTWHSVFRNRNQLEAEIASHNKPKVAEKFRDRKYPVEGIDYWISDSKPNPCAGCQFLDSFDPDKGCTKPDGRRNLCSLMPVTRIASRIDSHGNRSGLPFDQDDWFKSRGLVDERKELEVVG